MGIAYYEENGYMIHNIVMGHETSRLIGKCMAGCAQDDSQEG